MSNDQSIKKLLIVDDDEAVRGVLTEMLRTIIEEIHEIYTAENGEKAVELAKQMTFDGVFTDMQMPGMDGLDTLRELKKLQPEITVIVMTGNASQERLDAALREGAVDCLMKPFTTTDLRAVLERN